MRVVLFSNPPQRSLPHTTRLPNCAMADIVIYIPYPTPATLSCPLCHVAFKQTPKRLHMAKHVAENHPGHETKLKCASCCAEFTNARSAGRHKCAGEIAPRNEVATVRLAEDSAIYEYRAPRARVNARCAPGSPRPRTRRQSPPSKNTLCAPTSWTSPKGYGGIESATPTQMV